MLLERGNKLWKSWSFLENIDQVKCKISLDDLRIGFVTLGKFLWRFTVLVDDWTSELRAFVSNVANWVFPILNLKLD